LHSESLIYTCYNNTLAHIYKPIRHGVSQAHWVGSKPIHRVMQLKLHKPTMALGYSLRMCTRRRFNQSSSK